MYQYVLPGILRVEDLYKDERHYYTRYGNCYMDRQCPPYHLSFDFCDDEA